jgi:stage V sporulation protein B
LHEKDAINLLRYLAFVLPAYGLFALYSGYYSGLQNFYRQASLNVIYSITKTILIITLVYKFGLIGVIMGFIIAPVVSLLTGFVVPRGKIEISTLKILLLEAIPLTAFAVIASSQLAVDLLLVKGLIAGAASAGIYAACQSIAMIPYYGLSSISQVLLPSISELHHVNNYEDIKTTITNGVRYITLIVVPICLIISALASQIITLLFGNKYINGTECLRIMIIGYMFLTIYMVITSVLNGIGKAKRSMLLSIIGVAITAVACSFFIPKKGIVGAAISVLIAGLTILILAFVLLKQYTQFNIPKWSIIRIFISASIASFLAYIINPTSTLSPFVGLGAIIIYILGLLILGEITNEERIFLKRIVVRGN